MKMLLTGFLALCCAAPLACAQQKIFEIAHIDDGAHEWVRTAWRMRTDGSGPGYSVALIDRARYPDSLPAIEDWTEPNAPGVLAIAFDTDNPPPTEEAREERGERPPMAWFDERGNFYDRPQREVSVHENDRERLNVFSEFDYTTGEWIDASLRVRYEPGAAFVTVILGGHPVLRDAILPGVEPMSDLALVFAGPEAFLDEGLDLDGTKPETGSPIEPYDDPVRVTVFDAYFIHAGDQRPEATVSFEGVPEDVARVVATCTLSEPDVGYDHWDKKLQFTIEDDEGRAYEVLRLITPFRRGWTWRADVTDLLPLFEGERAMGAWIETYMKGWDVTLTLDFYPGVPDLEPIAVVPLWDGSPEIGNPENPASAFFETRTVPVPDGATHAVVRTTVTGHGMAPNSGNAGEFMPLGRTLTVRSEAGKVVATDPLWKTDVYLNPCRPQGGTWKFDRAGWAPGDLVLPWRVDVSTVVEPGAELTIDYELDEYVNENRGQTWAPHHWTSAHIVFMRER